MPTYLYGVFPAGRATPLASLHGIEDAPVRVLGLGSIDAWVSTMSGGLPDSHDADRRRKLGLAHDRVLSAALESGVTPVPARAGQRFADDDECLASLENHRDRYIATLERLDGLVEMTATLLLPGTPNTVDSHEVSGGPGKRHLDRLRARHSEIEHVREQAIAAAAEISELVEPLTKGVAVRARMSPRTGVAVSHLVARSDTMEYRQRLADQLLKGYGSRVKVTGPVAPYSFVGDIPASRS